MKPKRLALALMLAALLCAGTARAESAAAVRARNITGDCQIKVSEGSARALTDDRVKTAWTYEQADAWIAVRIPAEISPGGMMIEWMFDPEGMAIVEYDGDMNVLRERDQGCTFPGIVSFYNLLPETRNLLLRMTAPGQEVCSLQLCSQGELSEDVQLWRKPVDKADLMVVSTHQDDELIFFGGTIPYYAVAMERPTVVVYMANCTRLRRKEALDGLWTMGVRDYPEFINLRDHRVGSLEEGLELWGGRDNVLRVLVERIRRYKPEVIVTHDLDGEYGHRQHRITAHAMSHAIEAAADPGQYPDSCDRYGAWQVKKLYLHLYGKRQLTMDWKTPLEALGGRSPLEMAQKGYAKHESQQQYYQVVDGGKYDNAKFGLYMTKVGADEAKDDFFEHIEAAPVAAADDLAGDGGISGGAADDPAVDGDISGDAPEDPEDPAPELAGAGSGAPEPAPAATPEPVPGAERNDGPRWALIALGAAGLAAGGGAVILSRRARRRRHRRRTARR